MESIFPHNRTRDERGVSLEKLVIILDKVPEYATQLAVYLNNRRSFPFRAVVFAFAEEAAEYVNSGAVHAVVAAECFEKEVLRLALSGDVKVFWISENKKLQDRSVLYRYQSAKEIERRLTEEGEKKSRNVSVIGIYTPGGGREAEPLSYKIAAGFSGFGKVLYLSLFPFGTCNRGRDGMSELLFFLKQQAADFSERLPGILQSEEGMDVCGPVRWHHELWTFTKEDVENLLCCIESKTEYNTVVFAVGQCDRTGLAVLQCCGKILTPVWETEEGERLQKEFLRQMRETGETGILSGLAEVPVRPGEWSGDFRAVVEKIRNGEER